MFSGKGGVRSSKGLTERREAEMTTKSTFDPRGQCGLLASVFCSIPEVMVSEGRGNVLLIGWCESLSG